MLASHEIQRENSSEPEELANKLKSTIYVPPDSFHAKEGIGDLKKSTIPSPSLYLKIYSF